MDRISIYAASGVRWLAYRFGTLLDKEPDGVGRRHPLLQGNVKREEPQPVPLSK
jgi:hypothetical protein